MLYHLLWCLLKCVTGRPLIYRRKKQRNTLPLRRLCPPRKTYDIYIDFQIYIFFCPPRSARMAVNLKQRNSIAWFFAKWILANAAVSPIIPRVIITALSQYVFCCYWKFHRLCMIFSEPIKRHHSFRRSNLKIIFLHFVFYSYFVAFFIHIFCFLFSNVTWQLPIFILLLMFRTHKL